MIAISIALDILKNEGSCSRYNSCDISCPLYNAYPEDIISGNFISSSVWDSWMLQKLSWAKDYIAEHPEELLNSLL